ncbi:MAG: fibronectin type III domain-containing protein, partial [Ruminiclostridium sp.]|nr:fibronectin type III domain-containing protein [Ruminiclostridium sp.]
AYNPSHYMMEWVGPFPENEDYPYNSSGDPTIAGKQFTESEWTAILDSQVAQLTGFFSVNSSDPDYIQKIKRLVYTYGGVSMGYHHMGETDTTENPMNIIEGEHYYYCPFDNSSNHNIAVVGYDDSIPKEKFTNNGCTPEGDGAWLIKNSWGDYSHNGGYFWMSYYDKSINTAYAYDFAMEGDADYYDNLITMDGAPSTVSVSYGKPMVHSAAVFTAEKEEIIKAASFYATTTVLTDAEVMLYLNPEEGNPSSGTLAATGTITIDTPGSYTVNFPKGVSVNKGDKYAVVLKQETRNGETVSASYESRKPSTDTQFQVVANCNPGESYISYSGEYWNDSIDTETRGNARIKVYTDDKTPLAKPVLNTTMLEDTRIHVDWDKVEGAESYELYVAKGDEDLWLITSKNASSTGAYLTNLINAEYRFLLKAFADDGLTVVESDEIKIRYNVTFSQPSITVTDTSYTTATLSWTKNTSGRGYEIQQYTDNKWETIATITDRETESYEVSGLTPGDAHKFRMRTVRTMNGELVASKYSPTVTVNARMTSVKNFTSPSRSTSAIRLNWKKNAYADGYVIEQYDGSKWVQIADITDGETITYKVTGLKSGTAYKFRMKAYAITKYGVTIYGAKTDTLTANTQASAVTGLALKSRSSTALRLKWTKNAAVDGYVIEQKIGGEWVQIADIDNYATTEYKVTGLKASTKYSFRMKAYAITKYGDKTYSTYTDVLAKTTNPSAISGLTVKSKSQTAIRLAWNKNTSADGYLIEQYKDGKWVQIADVNSNATTEYKVTGLAGATTYKFRVRTYNMIGETALYSEYKTVSGKTL